MSWRGVSPSVRELGRALREGSTLPARFIVGLASVIWGIGLATIGHDNWEENRAFLALRAISNRWIWASAFLILGALIFWRIIDRHARTGWSHATNSLTFGFWMMVTFLRLWHRLEIWPVMATDVALCLLSLWVALRVDITPRDRETA